MNPAVIVAVRLTAGQGVAGSNPVSPPSIPLTTSRQVVRGFVIDGERSPVCAPVAPRLSPWRCVG